ncbi:MAG: BMP family protein [Chlorobia bacterium]|nr:BMP family protein [Fimbriimonadaceae bacterium]
MMKPVRMLPLLALVFAFGCSGGDKTPTETTGSTAAKSNLKVALLTPGPVSDSGWNAMAYKGLQEIQKELGAEVNNQEALDAKIKDAARTYAQQGYKLIFGHGFEYNKPFMEIGKDFPDTIFVSSSGSETGANVGAFRFYLEQGFYLAGMMGAKMSKTGTLAMVGGDEVPSIKSTFTAFKAGAEAAKPGIKVIQVFTGSGQDVAKAKQATLDAISQGADFVIHQANAAAQGVFDACKEKGVYAFGANADQNDNPSGAVIASAISRGESAFVEVAKQVEGGTFRGGVALMGMDKGVIDFIINPKMADKVPADLKSLIEETKAKIVKGELTVPKDEF